MPKILTMLPIANLIAFVCCFASFGWAMKRHFRKVNHMPGGAHLIQIVGGIFTLAHLVALLRWGNSRAATALVGLLLYCASFALFWVCIRINRAAPLSIAFSTDKPAHLITRGPYRYVRHPFYASYSLAWMAGIVAGRQPWLLISLLAMGAIYYRAAALEERKFASGNLAAAYEEYRRHTGMFIPRLAIFTFNQGDQDA
ncbi:MAG: isoprenylcysteine carboxylmethyltransferase family protein [Acidobacteriota bacterium]